KIAVQGSVSEVLLKEWLRDTFLYSTPPKTTGREAYGKQFAKKAFEQAKVYDVSPQDLVATVTEFTARTIFDHYNRFLFPHHSIDEICVSGGGIHNLTLIERLKKLFNPIPILFSDSYGIPSDGKEAIAFAILANEAIYGHQAGLPQITGATQPKVLGKLAPV
ncbi:MAG: anhydro-N-acetylmuramic acid kinase, partial [Candidatus Poribacteria bacterium]|nr:anhydro-N-acetylmuramic acid kinase [Candidatus Poribacteria bacterium]